MAHTWLQSQKLRHQGKSAQEAQSESFLQQRTTLRSELADLLAYTIKLANYTGIDLEEAYLEKMRVNVQRTWEL